MEEYRCLDCGHEFPSREPTGEAACPRCGGRDLIDNPWLLGSPDAAGLTSDDYREHVRVTT